MRKNLMNFANRCRDTDKKGHSPSQKHKKSCNGSEKYNDTHDTLPLSYSLITSARGRAKGSQGDLVGYSLY
jgi:hypothetical protein